jgi:hypothetical protein
MAQRLLNEKPLGEAGQPGRGHSQPASMSPHPWPACLEVWVGVPEPWADQHNGRWCEMDDWDFKSWMTPAPRFRELAPETCRQEALGGFGKGRWMWGITLFPVEPRSG